MKSSSKSWSLYDHIWPTQNKFYRRLALALYVCNGCFPSRISTNFSVLLKMSHQEQKYLWLTCLGLTGLLILQKRSLHDHAEYPNNGDFDYYSSRVEHSKCFLKSLECLGNSIIHILMSNNVILICK